MAPRESGPEAKQEQAQGLKMCCAPIVGRSRSVKSTCLRRRLPVSDPRRRPGIGLPAAAGLSARKAPL